MDPQDHFCSVDDLDYQTIPRHGLVRILCQVCGRVWRLTIKGDVRGKIGFWNAYPHCQPLPSTTRERFPIDQEGDKARAQELRDSRQARLNEMDRIARERADSLSESDAAFQRWQRAGGGIKVRFAKTIGIAFSHTTVFKRGSA